MLLVFNTKSEVIRTARLAGRVSFCPISCSIWKLKDSQTSNLASSSAVSAGKKTLAPHWGTSATHSPGKKLSFGFTGCKVSNISHRAGWRDPFLSGKKQRKEGPFFWRQLISIDRRDYYVKMHGQGRRGTKRRAALSHPGLKTDRNG